MGKLDYLVVKEQYRKHGIGDTLMRWAMETFDACSINKIEVKVVEGNSSIHFYEKYGFQTNARLMWHVSK